MATVNMNAFRFDRYVHGVLYALLLCGLCSVFLFTPSATEAQAIPAAVQNTCNQRATATGFAINSLTANSDGTFNCQLKSLLGVQAPIVIGANGSLVSNPQQAVLSEEDLTGPPTCTSWRGALASPITCLWRSMFVAIGTVVVSVVAWLLTAAGLIFNFLLDYTVIEFASRVYGPIRDGVEVGWQAFRDISNIVIIGMFTFIALSMILGIETFGQRRFVARVLIIAVLINFSLLFTKIIIDASHFVAHEFYKAALVQVAGAGGVQSGPTGTGQEGSFATKGIAGQFIQLTGLPGVWDTASSLLDISDKTQSGWATLAHSIAAATLILAVALVMLYGAFILVARAVILIFLLTTSSLAFASYLIPKIASGDYGWSAWWKLLINNAIFAPLLMMFLWMTLAVGNRLTGSNGTLGNFITKPTDPAGISVIFGYLLIVGMLFASLRVANNFASAASKKFAGMAVGGVFRGAGFAGRNTLGFGALAALSTGLTSRIPNWAGRRSIEGGLAKAATSSFDVRSVPGLADAAKFAGIANLGKPSGAGGKAQAIKDRDKSLVNAELATRSLVGRETFFDRRRGDKIAQLKGEQESDDKKLKNMEALEKKLRAEATPQSATPAAASTATATATPKAAEEDKKQGELFSADTNLGKAPMSEREKASQQGVLDESRMRQQAEDAKLGAAAEQRAQQEKGVAMAAQDKSIDRDAALARQKAFQDTQTQVVVESSKPEGLEELTGEIKRLREVTERRTGEIKRLEEKQPKARVEEFNKSRQNAFYFNRPLNVFDNAIGRKLSPDAGKTNEEIQVESAQSTKKAVERLAATAESQTKVLNTLVNALNNQNARPAASTPTTPETPPKPNTT